MVKKASLKKSSPKKLTKTPKKSGRPYQYTTAEIKRGLGTAGRTKKQIADRLTGKPILYAPKAFRPWKPLPPDIKGPARVKQFFKEHITHTTGKWKGLPFKFLPWQIDLIDKLFGTLTKDKSRQYKQAYLEIGKKNGKTELAAGLGIYLLLEDGEGSPEVAIAAADRKQASICFNVAAQMVRQDGSQHGPDDDGQTLSQTLKIIDSQKKLYDKYGNGVLEVVSSETASKHGLNLSGLIFDELHAQKTRDLYVTMTEGSGAARRQPIFLYLTTAGWDRKSICWEIHVHADEVRKGIVDDPTFLPIIYDMPPKSDWKDEKNWAYPNPALGTIFDVKNLRESFQKASQMPLFENDFRRLRLNEWTQQQVRWLSIDRWDECRGKINLSSLLKKPCYGGLDLSSTQDLTVFLLIFPLGDGYTVLPFFFCPEENIVQRSHRDKVMYDVWAQMGLLIPTPGNVIDYSFVEAKIDDCRKLYDLKEIAFDRYKANELVQHLQDKGVTVVPIAQNQTGMNSSINELEKLVLGKKLVHDGNPVMRWMCNNVSLKKNAGGMVMFDKEKSSEKIDGMVSLVMALDRAIRHPTSKSGHLIVIERTAAAEDVKSTVTTEHADEKIFCPRCDVNTEGITFCADCGRRRSLTQDPGQDMMARATV